MITPLVEYLKLQVRFNTKSRAVEMRTSELTEDPGAAQKGQVSKFETWIYFLCIRNLNYFNTLTKSHLMI